MTDLSCVPALRTLGEQALERLTEAAKVARRNGLEATADDFASLAKQLKCRTDAGGILDWLEDDGALREAWDKKHGNRR